MIRSSFQYTRRDLPFHCGFDPEKHSFREYVGHIMLCGDHECERRYTNHLMLKAYFIRKYAEGGDGMISANERDKGLGAASSPSPRPGVRATEAATDSKESRPDRRDQYPASARSVPAPKRFPF